ncbi:MAG: T9SS type A sorting domain-containing protein [Fidelibacterota bacterium]|nr:MAG: T9SS type A sorting domain-containing protein [Candidatus Neomarinimicrobiota bacterium]
MKLTSIIKRTSHALAIIVSMTVLAHGQSKLLLTEIVVTPTVGEYIEIYNPGSEVVNLTNYYISDVSVSQGTYYYHTVETGIGNPAGGGGASSDFNAKFPDGATILSGEFQTIALNGSDNFFNEFGVLPTYELYEDAGSPDVIPDMAEADTGSINNQGDLSDSDEVLILFYWDGDSDLVIDVDYLIWGASINEQVDKTGIKLDGPDEGSDSTLYQSDTPAAEQKYATAPAAGFSAQRVGFGEGLQVSDGGNGIDGADETSENMDSTWVSTFTPTPNEAFYWPRTIAQMEVDADSNFVPDLLDYWVEIVGVVTSPNFQSPGTDTDFYIQDTTGGTNIFYLEQDTTYALGDSLKIEGAVDHFDGMTGLHPEDGDGLAHVTWLAIGSPIPDPEVITLAQLQDDFDSTFTGEAIEGNLVTTSDWIWLEDDGSITDGTLTATMEIDSDLDIIENPSQGRRFNVTAIASQSAPYWGVRVGQWNSYEGYQLLYDLIYFGGYRLLPRFSSDFELNPFDPGIPLIEDVADDEGGFLTVTWARSLNDSVNVAPADSILRYVVWSLGLVDTTPVDTVDANLSDEYSVVAETEMNRTPYRYVVYAYTAIDSSKSLPGEGFSIDNIAPSAPKNLTVTQPNDSVAAVLVSWDAGTEPDLDHYYLFRTIPGELDTVAWVLEPAITEKLDDNVENGGTYDYTVAAVDINGNLSDGNPEVSITVSDVTDVEDEVLLPQTFALHPAYPNPFNPVSTIRYDLPQGSEISLIVYNILGREVARLVDSYMEPGYHQAQWNGRNSSSRELPSGIYIARLITPEYTNSIKMLLLK